MLQRSLLLGLILAVPFGTSAGAQSADACAKFKWSITREQQAFSGAKLSEVRSGGQYPGVMEAVTADLRQQSEVSYPQPPARAPKATPAYGAVFEAPSIAIAGTYQITLSDAAWIDVLQNGQKLRSVGTSGQAGCPGVRKSVRFPLAVGPVTIEISDSAKPTLKLIMVPTQ